MVYGLTFLVRFNHVMVHTKIHSQVSFNAALNQKELLVLWQLLCLPSDLFMGQQAFNSSSMGFLRSHFCCIVTLSK